MQFGRGICAANSSLCLSESRPIAVALTTVSSSFVPSPPFVRSALFAFLAQPQRAMGATKQPGSVEGSWNAREVRPCFAQLVLSFTHAESPGDVWSPLIETMRTFKASWPARGWSWDSRVGCVSSSFSTEFEAKARASAAAALPLEFLSSTVTRAPAMLQELAERSGGLRSGQLLLSAPVFNGVLAFGLWWPWGDGETISFRVGLANVDPAREPYLRFRDVFNVSL